MRSTDHVGVSLILIYFVLLTCEVYVIDREIFDIKLFSDFVYMKTNDIKFYVILHFKSNLKMNLYVNSVFDKANYTV